MLNQYTALDAVGAVTAYGYDVMGQTWPSPTPSAMW